jgi:hypothetical protein
MIYAPDLTRSDQTAVDVLRASVRRREAQAEAQLAYEAWCRVPGRDGHAVYRAAQDRADAAQDELAAWVRTQADPTSG